VTDIERIRRDLIACRDIPWSCSCVEPEQLAALLAEVEQLRTSAASSTLERLMLERQRDDAVRDAGAKSVALLVATERLRRSEAGAVEVGQLVRTLLSVIHDGALLTPEWQMHRAEDIIEVIDALHDAVGFETGAEA
jgi:hypothetical protein